MKWAFKSRHTLKSQLVKDGLVRYLQAQLRSLTEDTHDSQLFYVMYIQVIWWRNLEDWEEKF